VGKLPAPGKEEGEGRGKGDVNSGPVALFTKRYVIVLRGGEVTKHRKVQLGGKELAKHLKEKGQSKKNRAPNSNGHTPRV